MANDEEGGIWNLWGLAEQGLVDQLQNVLSEGTGVRVDHRYVKEAELADAVGIIYVNLRLVRCSGVLEGVSSVSFYPLIRQFLVLHNQI